MSIIQFRHAKLLQNARMSGITISDIARALAHMDGIQPLSDFDAGSTSMYLSIAEALLELAIDCAKEQQND